MASGIFTVSAQLSVTDHYANCFNLNLDLTLGGQGAL